MQQIFTRKHLMHKPVTHLRRLRCGRWRKLVSATRFTSAERKGAVLATTRALPAGDYVGSRAQFSVPQLRAERKRKTSSKLDENNITQRGGNVSLPTFWGTRLMHHNFEPHKGTMHAKLGLGQPQLESRKPSKP